MNVTCNNKQLISSPTSMYMLVIYFWHKNIKKYSLLLLSWSVSLHAKKSKILFSLKIKQYISKVITIWLICYIFTNVNYKRKEEKRVKWNSFNRQKHLNFLLIMFSFDLKNVFWILLNACNTYICTVSYNHLIFHSMQLHMKRLH